MWAGVSEPPADGIHVYWCEAWGEVTDGYFFGRDMCVVLVLPLGPVFGVLDERQGPSDVAVARVGGDAEGGGCRGSAGW